MLTTNRAVWVLAPFVVAAIIIIYALHFSPDSNLDAQIRRATLARARNMLDEVNYYDALNGCYSKPLVETWIDFYERGSRSNTEDGRKMTRVFCREYIMAVIDDALDLMSDDPFAQFELKAEELLREALERWAKTKEEDLTSNQQERFDALLRAAGVE